MPAEMRAARARVLAAAKAHKINFLNSVNPKNVVQMIQEGVMIGASGQPLQRLPRLGRDGDVLVCTLREMSENNEMQ